MPVSHSFELTVPFQHVTDPAGRSYWFPLVTLTILRPNGQRASVPLLFDTGASTTTLRRDLFPLLGAARWDEGTANQAETAGGTNTVTMYRYENIPVEILGKPLRCPIDLADLPSNPLYAGLLGREVLFDEFGFGFWETTHELHVTANP